MQLTIDQQRAYSAILDFLQKKEKQLFVLTGYAGTGKTTLVKKVLEVLQKAERPCRLLAANDFRQALDRNHLLKYPKVRFSNDDALHIVKDHHRLLETYIREIKALGFQQAIMLGYANWQIGMLNRNIRKKLYNSADLQQDELLMVVQNNDPTGLAKGDLRQQQLCISNGQIITYRFTLVLLLFSYVIFFSNSKAIPSKNALLKSKITSSKSATYFLPITKAAQSRNKHQSKNKK